MVQDGLISYCYFKNQSEVVSHCVENGFDEYLLLATEVFEERYKKYFLNEAKENKLFEKIKYFELSASKISLTGLNISFEDEKVSQVDDGEFFCRIEIPSLVELVSLFVCVDDDLFWMAYLYFNNSIRRALLEMNYILVLYNYLKNTRSV